MDLDIDADDEEGNVLELIVDSGECCHEINKIKNQRLKRNTLIQA